MAFKKFRKMKVYEASGYNYKRTPSIILKGDWLKETGVDISGLIQVECENGKLIITQREPEMVDTMLHVVSARWWQKIVNVMARKGESDYGKDYRIRCYEGWSRQVRLHLQPGIFIEQIREESISGRF